MRERPASGGAAGFSLVSAGYFETFKIPVLRGRTFTERDGSGPPVAIINQTLARQFWPNGDPLDGQIIVGNEPRQIIGVVGDVRDNALNRDPRPIVYLAFGALERGDSGHSVGLGDPDPRGANVFEFRHSKGAA